jgi:hypothetical protein
MLRKSGQNVPKIIQYLGKKFYFNLFWYIYLKKVARAGERTRDLLILFIFSLHHFTAEPQRLPFSF